MDVEGVFRFLLALALTPFVFTLGRGIRMPRAVRVAFMISLFAIVVGFGMSAAGAVVVWTPFRFLRHVVVAVGGFGLAWAAWMSRLHELETAEAGR
jgi:hypothetical protein